MKYFKYIFFATLFTLVSIGANAQCAMCRVGVENNISSGEGFIGAGLNTGILYLMMMPYILLAVIAYFWYKSSKHYTNKKIEFTKMIKNVS